MSLFGNNKENYKDKKSLVIYFSRADENYAVGYIEKGNTENALYYEMCDMEEAVRNQDASHLNLEYTKDVMDIMSQLRKEWKMQYPGEKW